MMNAARYTASVSFGLKVYIYALYSGKTAEGETGEGGERGKRRRRRTSRELAKRRCRRFVAFLSSARY